MCRRRWQRVAMWGVIFSTISKAHPWRTHLVFSQCSQQKATPRKQSCWEKTAALMEQKSTEEVNLQLGGVDAAPWKWMKLCFSLPADDATYSPQLYTTRHIQHVTDCLLHWGCPCLQEEFRRLKRSQALFLHPFSNKLSASFFLTLYVYSIPTV